MDWWLIFAIFLYLICAVLILAEIFVPSGGLISVCALAALAGGIVIFFNQSMLIGWIGVIVAIVMIPSVLIIAYKWFPKSRFGKTVTLAPPKRDLGDAIPDSPEIQELLGKQAQVISDLRPVGMCDFSGKRIECVAETGYIEQGQTVTVIRVQGTQLTVRETDNS